MEFIYYLSVFFLGFRGIEFYGIKFADLLILILFIGLVGSWLHKSRKLFINNRFILLFLLFYSIVLASLFKVDDFTYSVLDPFRYALVGVFFICIINMVRKPQHLKTTTKLIVISGLITSLISIVVFILWYHGIDVSAFLHKVSSGQPEGRTQALFYDPNHYASFLLLPAFSCVYFFLSAYKKRNPFAILGYFLAFVIISIALVSTGSRSGVLSLVFGLGCTSALYFWKRFYRNNMLITALFFLICLLLLLLFSVGYYLNPNVYIKQLQFVEFRHGTVEKGLFLRIQLWRGALYAFKDNPLFGVGISDFINDYPSIAQKYDLYVGAQNFPHNSYLDLLAEMGLFGFLTGISLLIYIYKKAIYNLRYGFDQNFSIVLLSLLISQSANMLVSSMFHARRLWFIFALIVSYTQIIKTRRSRFNGEE